MVLKMIEKYISQMEANGLSKYTIKATKQVLTKLNDFKSLDEITKNDLVKYFKNLIGTDEVKRLHQSKIKKFFTDNGKPELVEWIKLIKPKQTLRADDILTPDDINKLLESTEGLYWKTLIAFLFETGCRISEARALKFKDFRETNDGLIVDIPTTKTASGFRRMSLTLSRDYIRQMKLYTSLPTDNEMFYMSESHTEQVLKKIAKKAGIEKPVNPHAFRHASATLSVQQRTPEAIIRKKYGWSPTSTMISRYQHLNDNSIVEAELGHKVDLKPIDIVQPEKKPTLVDAAIQISRLQEQLDESKEHNQELNEKIELLMKIADKQQASIEELREAEYEKRMWEMTPMFQQEQEGRLDYERNITGGLTFEDESKRIQKLMKKQKKKESHPKNPHKATKIKQD
jgi:integrase